MSGYIVLGAFIIGVIGAYTAQEWRYGEQLAIIKAEQATELSKAYAEAQGLQDRINRNDKLAVEALHDLQTRNDDLRVKYDGVSNRLRIKATCPVSVGASAASVADAGTAELSPESGRNILDIRAGIILCESQRSGLQSYAASVSGSKTDAPKN